jgi:hypothetical protein
LLCCKSGTTPVTCYNGYDTNDNNASINPGASDANCNGIDDNGNGQIDENYSPYTCGQGICARQSTCSNGVATCNPGPAGSRNCDSSLDNDCQNGPDNLETDCKCKGTDFDKDGYSTDARDAGKLCCKGGTKTCLSGVDCNDFYNKTYPGATEICDGDNNDCIGNVPDEGLTYCTYEKFWCVYLTGAKEYDPNMTICNGVNISAKVNSPELKCCLGTTTLKPGFDVYWASTANGAYKLLGAGQGDYIYCIAKGVVTGTTVNFGLKVPGTKSEFKTATGGMASSSQVLAEEKGKYSCTVNAKTAEINVAEAGKSQANLPVFGIMQFIIAFSLIIIYQFMRSKNIKVKGSASHKLKPNPLASNQN